MLCWASGFSKYVVIAWQWIVKIMELLYMDTIVVQRFLSYARASPRPRCAIRLYPTR